MTHFFSKTPFIIALSLSLVFFEIARAAGPGSPEPTTPRNTPPPSSVGGASYPAAASATAALSPGVEAPVLSPENEIARALLVEFSRNAQRKSLGEFLKTYQEYWARMNQLRQTFSQEESSVFTPDKLAPEVLKLKQIAEELAGLNFDSTAATSVLRYLLGFPLHAGLSGLSLERELTVPSPSPLPLCEPLLETALAAFRTSLATVKPLLDAVTVVYESISKLTAGAGEALRCHTLQCLQRQREAAVAVGSTETSLRDLLRRMTEISATLSEQFVTLKTPTSADAGAPRTPPTFLTSTTVSELVTGMLEGARNENVEGLEVISAIDPLSTLSSELLVATERFREAKENYKKVAQLAEETAHYRDQVVLDLNAAAQETDTARMAFTQAWEEHERAREEELRSRWAYGAAYAAEVVKTYAAVGDMYRDWVSFLPKNGGPSETSPTTPKEGNQETEQPNAADIERLFLYLSLELASAQNVAGAFLTAQAQGEPESSLPLSLLEEREGRLRETLQRIFEERRTAIKTFEATALRASPSHPTTSPPLSPPLSPHTLVLAIIGADAIGEARSGRGGTVRELPNDPLGDFLRHCRGVAGSLVNWATGRTTQADATPEANDGDGKHLATTLTASDTLFSLTDLLSMARRVLAVMTGGGNSAAAMARWSTAPVAVPFDRNALSVGTGSAPAAATGSPPDSTPPPPRAPLSLSAVDDGNAAYP